MGSEGGAAWLGGGFLKEHFGLGLEHRPTSVVPGRKLHREEPGD